eukprot:6139412-Prymnesium_polylepis.1
MGGTKYEQSLHQPYPNGSPAPNFGMYLRFPCLWRGRIHDGVLGPGITIGRRLVTIDIHALTR